VVNEEIINLLKSRVGEDGFVRMNCELRPGDKVVIKAGPLRNLVGVFDAKCKEHERVFILLTTVSFQSRVVIDEDLVTKVGL
jgi:transcription antitermination factor NusG